MTTPATFDLGGSGGNAFPFDRIGDSVRGTVLNLEEVQQTDMDTNDPAFWPDGKPKMMYRLTLQTELRTPGDPTDDGVRSVYLRGRRKPDENGNKSSLAAMLEAVRAVTGGTQIAAGADAGLTWVAEGAATKRGYNPPKFYEGYYAPPAMDLSGQVPVQQVPVQQTPVQQMPAQQVPAQQVPVQQAPVQQAPVQQQVGTPQAAVAALTPQQIENLKAAGVPIDALTPTTAS